MDISWDYSLQESPRLLDQVREELRKRHYSRRTEEAYLSWIARFLQFHGIRHPLEMGKTDVEAFLSHLVTDRKVAASTQNQRRWARSFSFTVMCSAGSLSGSTRSSGRRNRDAFLWF